MQNSEINIGLRQYAELFTTEEDRKSETIRPVALSDLKPYSEQPFKVLIDESMYELVASIKHSGVLSPIVARPHPEGGYEILSGHRRAKACEMAGIREVPVVVKDLDDDTATILLVDSNLQREHILPSEKAKAYQMKLEAMKRKAGRPAHENESQFATHFPQGRSDVELAEQVGESKDQIRRYIRLNNLIDPILDMVDNKELALNAAVELSYLGSKEQAEVLDAIESEVISPSIEQAREIRGHSEEGNLNKNTILSIMRKEKEEKRKITLNDAKLKKYFPESFTKQQIEDTIMKLIEGWYRKRKQERER